MDVSDHRGRKCVSQVRIFLHTVILPQLPIFLCTSAVVILCTGLSHKRGLMLLYSLFNSFSSATNGDHQE